MGPPKFDDWMTKARFSVIFIDFHGFEGLGVPGLMTGSAGTAMDVLVTCFSKEGGGSGRRVCKNQAPLVISVLRMDSFPGLLGSLKVWQALYFGHI